MADDYFAPFAELETSSSFADFDFADWSDSLQLTDVQKALLSYLLRDIRITVWFNSHEDHARDTLSLAVLFNCRTVREINLTRLIQKNLEDLNQIGSEREIAVLERLQEMIAAEIRAREPQP